MLKNWNPQYVSAIQYELLPFHVCTYYMMEIMISTKTPLVQWRKKQEKVGGSSLNQSYLIATYK